MGFVIYFYELWIICIVCFVIEIKEFDMYSNENFINREISWLSFNERVLQEAEDPDTPLFERIRFIGIFSNNLDEFFRVRVATVSRMVDFGIDEENLLGNYTPHELHEELPVAGFSEPWRGFALAWRGDGAGPGS